MTTIRISDPIDLIKIIPYQLGYHPERSVVVIGLRRRQVGLMQRLDLPVSSRDCVGAADLLVAHLRREDCRSAFVAVYENRAGEGDAASAALLQRMDRHRIELVDHVVVRAGQVHFPGPRDGSVGRGAVVLPSDDEVPAVADFVARGVRPAAGRDALDERLAPESGPLSDRVVTAVSRLGPLRPVRSSRRSAMASWGRFLDVRDEAWFSARTPSAAAVARLVHSLRDLQVRDLLAAWLCPGTLTMDAFDAELVALRVAHFPPVDGDEARTDRHERLVERLCWLARHTPQSYAAGVLTLLASYVWWLGDGTLARLALDRALAIEPSYRLALLMERMVDLAIRPQSAMRSTG